MTAEIRRYTNMELNRLRNVCDNVDVIDRTSKENGGRFIFVKFSVGGKRYKTSAEVIPCGPAGKAYNEAVYLAVGGAYDIARTKSGESNGK